MKVAKVTIQIFTVLMVFSAAHAIAGQPLPDTGQTQSYTDTYGEDSDYTINPPSYTKLDAQGNSLPDDATNWAMVKNNVTGLIWAVKTDDGSIHDKALEYNWSDAKDVFIAGLNDQNFGGFSDWRLPTLKELAGIVDYGRYGPAINTDYFPYTIRSYYWSSTTYAYNEGNAWIVSFNSGIDNDYDKSDSCHARAVRAADSDL